MNMLTIPTSPTEMAQRLEVRTGDIRVALQEALQTLNNGDTITLSPLLKDITAQLDQLDSELAVASEMLATAGEVIQTITKQRDDAIEDRDELQENMTEIVDEQVNEIVGEALYDEILWHEEMEAHAQRVLAERLATLGNSEGAEALKGKIEAANAAKNELVNILDQAHDWLRENDDQDDSDEDDPDFDDEDDPDDLDLNGTEDD